MGIIDTNDRVRVCPGRTVTRFVFGIQSGYLEFSRAGRATAPNCLGSPANGMFRAWLT